MTNQELYEFIVEKCQQLGVTAYEISKKTDVNQQTAYRILNRKTENPTRRNLIAILQYLEGKIVGTGEQGTTVNEPMAGYNKTEFVAKDVYPQEIFTDVGTELLLSYKNQIRLFEKNASLYERNAEMMMAKINELSQKSHTQ